MSAPIEHVETGGSWFITDHTAARLAHYEHQWRYMIGRIWTRLGRGTSMKELVEAYKWDMNAYRGFIPDFVATGLNIDLAEFGAQAEPQRLAVFDGRYVSSSITPNNDGFIEFVARCVEPDVDCVVEFGSGLGFNLAQLRLRLPDAPITYIACEPSEAGREAARRIFTLDPAAHFLDYPFDYTRPNLDFLHGFRKIVAFSMHSIEQVPVLDGEFYRQLLRTNVAACVHVEPFGWQRFTRIADVVLSMHRDKSRWNRLLSDYVWEIRDSRVVHNAAMWSAQCGYNTDLLRIVTAAAESGVVALTTLAFEVIGGNPFNPSSLVAWRRAERPVAPTG